ncbi:MAG: gamma-glutamyl-gamma-aminobutyrate hydrolase family protein, partial [Rikenellaceae bacterium]|nr:gamma-glutamyl-gamma-aminobutyrate hydrolase family protein [Rikenellaceae bacterium]
RNDKIALDEVEKYDKILLSPGPGIPSESGILLELIRQYAPKKSILGICLGAQAIGESFGGRLENMPEVFHGIHSQVDIIADDKLFSGLGKQLQVGRYHSWIVSRDHFPECLTITAVDPEGRIMALSHKEYDVRGVQFHPESVLTPQGKAMLKNWLSA